MTVAEAIERAEAVLPGIEASDDEEDPRWQAIIAVGAFIEDEPDPVWSFVERWGKHTNEDLRQAIATCLLEHLLEHHFVTMFPRVKREAHGSRLFAATVAMCSRFGQAKEPKNAAKLDQLVQETSEAT